MQMPVFFTQMLLYGLETRQSIGKFSAQTAQICAAEAPELLNISKGDFYTSTYN